MNDDLRRKITLDHIAQQAGVSKFTVSKALSGQSGISLDTRDRVMRIATQLGYFLQQQAPSSATARSKRVGTLKSVLICMPNVRTQTLESHYWGRIVDGITDELVALGISTVILTEHASVSAVHAINMEHMLGIIGVGYVSTNLLISLKNHDVPLVLIDHEDPAVSCDLLYVDNFTNSVQLVQHLIGLGHRSIAFVGDVAFSPSFAERYRGYCTALQKNGIDLPDVSDVFRVSGEVNDDTIAFFTITLDQLQKNGTLPTAFMCANDELAIAMMNALQTKGLRVAQDVSVVGFDDIDEAADAIPSLTTVHVPKKTLGKRAVHALLARVKEPSLPYERILLSGNLVFRHSSDTLHS